MNIHFAYLYANLTISYRQNIISLIITKSKQTSFQQSILAYIYGDYAASHHMEIFISFSLQLKNQTFKIFIYQYFQRYQGHKSTSLQSRITTISANFGEF